MTTRRKTFRALTVAFFAIPVLVMNPIESVSVFEEKLSLNFQSAKAQQDNKEPQKTRRAMAISESVNKRLAKVSELLNPEDEKAKPNLSGALAEAKAINTGKWNEYEKAQLFNMMGGIYVQMENYPEAIRYYKRFVETPSVPPANQLNVSYYLAQLYLATENYKQAIRLFEDYIKRSEIVGADHYYKLGQAYYMDGNLNRSLPNIDKAVQMYESSDRIPPEGLYQYQMSLYHGKENYKKVVTVLEKMVRHYPKVNHWRTLAAMYGASGRPKDQLHAYDTIYMMGGLNKEKELRLLASLYLENEYPYKAAKVLEKGFKDKVIEPTSKNLELLGVSWSIAKEQDKSIPVMEQAASKSNAGDLYARLTQMYLGGDEYQKAVNAGSKALKRKLKKPASVHFNMAVSYFNLNKFDQALASLREARKDKTMASQANNWIRLVEGEKARVEKLKTAA
ncbi:MAG: tetratricopeptide repeat protein [Cellvibrionaceae bacterium]